MNIKKQETINFKFSFTDEDIKILRKANDIITEINTTLDDMEMSGYDYDIPSSFESFIYSITSHGNTLDTRWNNEL